jgi:DNA-binding transcriptional regulator YdaS (Cro superfamily)
MSDKETPLHRAVKALGGQAKVAAITKKKQPTISEYLRKGNAPADFCMRIELATGGEYTADQFRPDLADVFASYRALGKSAQQPSEAA